MDSKVVTRFAPSPTGFMHVGGVRTALYAWLWARKNKGQFILRIEDTDKEREVAGSIDHIMQSLRWLGLDWDQGPETGGPHAPYIQSERLEIYKKYAKILTDKGLAYTDDGALRFKVALKKRTEWTDIVWGELAAGPEALEDFVLIKSDGYPTYNFAHVVDDIEMGVTHVMRGQEFIASTPKFLALYEALGAKPPHFATLPPIMGPDGKKKLSKRDGAKDIMDYEKEGYLPEAMKNYLAFLGFNPGGEKEVYTTKELIEVFDLSKIQRSGAQWNDEKLLWFNKEHTKILPRNEVEKKILTLLTAEYEDVEDKDILIKITPLILERINKWGDVKNVAEELKYLFYKWGHSDRELPIWRDLKDNINKFEKTSEYLGTVIELLRPIEEKNWVYESIKNTLSAYFEKEGKGNILWPMRVALSVKEKSPDPFKLAEILGKSVTLERIEQTIKFLKDITPITIDTKEETLEFSEELANTLNTHETTSDSTSHPGINRL